MSMVVEGRRPASGQTQRGLSETILAAINERVPTKKAEIRPKLFQLARVLRSFPEVCETIEMQRQCFREWCRLSTGVELGGHDSLWAKFLDGWDRVAVPVGFDAVNEAWNRSADLKAPEAARFSEPEVVRLLAWFYELQKLHPRGAIYISSHKAAKRLGVSEKQVWEWQRMLEKEGILKCVLRGKARVFCTRYQYVSLIGDDEGEIEAPAWKFEDSYSVEVDESNHGEEVFV